MSESSNAISVDPLRLNACPTCNYSLQGLGEAGNCPECGERFDRTVVVLHGYARGSRAHAGNARPSVAVWWMLLPLFQILISARTSLQMKLMFFAGWLGLTTLYFLWRRRTDTPGLVQIELNDAGCRQFDVARRSSEMGSTPMTPWHEIDRIEIDVAPTRDPGIWIKLQPQFRWWQFARATVEAEVAGGPDALHALRSRISGWTGRPVGGVRAARPAGEFSVIIKPPQA